MNINEYLEHIKNEKSIILTESLEKHNKNLNLNPHLTSEKLIHHYNTFYNEHGKWSARPGVLSWVNYKLANGLHSDTDFINPNKITWL